MLVVNAGFKRGALNAQPGFGCAVAFCFVHPDQLMDSATGGELIYGDGVPRLVLPVVTELLAFGLNPDLPTLHGFGVGARCVGRVGAHGVAHADEKRGEGRLAALARVVDRDVDLDNAPTARQASAGSPVRWRRGGYPV